MEFLDYNENKCNLKFWKICNKNWVRKEKKDGQTIKRTYVGSIVANHVSDVKIR